MALDRRWLKSEPTKKAKWTSPRSLPQRTTFVPWTPPPPFSRQVAHPNSPQIPPQPRVGKGQAAPEKKKYGYVGFPLLPEHAAFVKRLAARIDPQDLAGDGVEQNPHVTALYGLHDDVTGQHVQQALQDEQPPKIKLGPVSTFPPSSSSDGTEVLKVDVHSPDLHRLHQKLRSLPHTLTHPDYKPHITIAYVKPGAAQKYVGPHAHQGTVLPLGDAEHSTVDKVKTQVRMGVGTGQGESEYGPFDPPGYPPPPDNSTFGPFDPPGYGAPDQSILDQDAQAKLQAQAPSDQQYQPPPQPQQEDRGWPGQVSDWASGASQGLGNLLHAPEAAQGVQQASQAVAENPIVQQASQGDVGGAARTYLQQNTLVGRSTVRQQQIQDAETSGDQATADRLKQEDDEDWQNAAVAMTMGPEEIGKPEGPIARSPGEQPTQQQQIPGLIETQADDMAYQIGALDAAGKAPNDQAYKDVYGYASGGATKPAGVTNRDWAIRGSGRAPFTPEEVAQARQAFSAPSTEAQGHTPNVPGSENYYLHASSHENAHNTGIDYSSEGGAQSPVWMSEASQGIPYRQGENVNVYGIRKDLLDPSKLDTGIDEYGVQNGYPKYNGPIPPEAITHLGKSTPDWSFPTTTPESQGPVPPTEPIPPAGSPPPPPEGPGGPTLAEQIRQGMQQGPTDPFDPRSMPPGVPRPKVEDIPQPEANLAREVLPEMAGTPEQAAQLRPPEEAHAGNVGLGPFPEETRPALEQMAEVDELNQFAGARQGVRSDPQVTVDAEEFARTHTLDYWENRDPHKPLSDVENEALGNTIVQQEQELRRLTARASDTMGRAQSPEDLAIARQHQAEAADQALTLATLVGARSGNASASGRALRSFQKALPGNFGSQSSAAMLDAAFKKIGLDRAEFTKFLQTYSAIPEDDFASRYRALQGLSKPSLWDKINTFAIGNILSGLPTQVVVFAHGTTMAYSRPFLTAVREGNLAGAWTDMQAMNRAWKSALPGMAEAFKTGVGPTSAQLQLAGSMHDVRPNVFPGKSGIVITPGLRAIAMWHELFNTISLAGAYETQAQEILGALRSGNAPEAGTAARQFYDGLKMRPQAAQQYLTSTPEDVLLKQIRQDMPAKAVRAASQSTTDTVLGGKLSPFGQVIQKARGFAHSDNPGEKAFGMAAQAIFPFVRYPDFYYRNGLKILAGPVAYPALAAKHALSAETRGLVGGDLRLAAVTTAFMAPIVYNAFQGNITGPGPRDPAQRQAMMAAREPDGSPSWRPLSVRLGGRWVPYTTLGGPLAVPMAAVGTAVDMVQNQGFTPEAIPEDTAKVFGAVLQTLADTSAYSNYTDIMGQIGTGDPKKMAEGTVAGMLGRLVPYAGATRQVAIGMDQNVKEPSGIGERISQNIPGLRQQVPNRTDVFGGAMRAPQDWLSLLTRSEGKAADLYNPALRGLTKLGIYPQPPDQKYELFPGSETKLTAEQQRDYRHIFGKTFASLWSQMTPAEQQSKEAMQATLSKARQQTTEGFKFGMTPDQIKAQTSIKLKGDPASQKQAIDLASDLRDPKQFPEYVNPQTGKTLGTPADWARWDQVYAFKQDQTGKALPQATLDQMRYAKQAALAKRDSQLFDITQGPQGPVIAVKDARYQDWNRWFGVYQGLDEATYQSYLSGKTPRYRDPATGAGVSVAQADAADRWLRLYRDTPPTMPLHAELRPKALAMIKWLTPQWEQQLMNVDKADLMEESGVTAEREAQFARTAP